MRVACGVIAAAALALGCNAEPDTGEAPGSLNLSPAVMYLGPGETKPVIARFFGPGGDQAHVDLSVETTPGLEARVDSTFRPVYAADGSLIQFPDLTEQRLLVTLTGAIDEGTVTVSGGEVSARLRVRRRP